MMDDNDITCWVWSKLSSKKWEDAWNERLASCPQYVIEYFGQKQEKIRIQAFLESKKEIDGLQKMFGGSIRSMKTQDCFFKQEVSNKLIKIKDQFIITQKEGEQHFIDLKRTYPERHILSFPPRLAFGTGDHLTTATCLRVLCSIIPQMKAGWSMYDLGTGTAILAIAASLLGAKAILGFDWDPQAIESAHGYIEHHGITNIKLVKQNVLEWEPKTQVPLIVANLFSTILVGAMANIVKALEEGGYLIISGILKDQWEEVQQAFDHEGLILVNKYETKTQPWITALIIKRENISNDVN